MTRRPITPPDFAALMRQLAAEAQDRPEIARRGVGIMAETLRRAGFEEGVDVWVKAAGVGG